jgi:pimeloyl-ACP methyl ester carboxylesterase
MSSRWLKSLLGILGGYALAQQFWVLARISRVDPQKTLLHPVNRLPRGLENQQTWDFETYVVEQVIEDGIEKISYFPKKPVFSTPLLFQHGMWMGAKGWRFWQASLAEMGWESHAISLPAHGASPEQRPIRMCTMDYYLGFLRDAVQKLQRPPVLVGHSMGGALIQWYMKYIGSDFLAGVLVAPWVGDSVFRDGFLQVVQLDPLVVPLSMLSWDTRSWIRNPARAAEKLLSKDSIVTPEELFEELVPESNLVVYEKRMSW